MSGQGARSDGKAQMPGICGSAAGLVVGVVVLSVAASAAFSAAVAAIADWAVSISLAWLLASISLILLA